MPPDLRGQNFRHPHGGSGGPQFGHVARVCMCDMAFHVAAEQSDGIQLGVASPPANAVAGLTFVQAESTSTGSQNFKNATVTCPGDTRVYSTGYDLVDGLGKVSVNTLQPSSDLRTVFVEANETDSGITSNWRVFAQAVCGQRGRQHEPELGRHRNAGPAFGGRARSGRLDR